MYLLFSFTMLMVGGILALCIRAELFQPGLQFFNPQLFNSFTTMHGLIMVFGAIMPAFVGFANWMIPMQIGAADMAFARMNNFSFWLLIPASLMLVGSFFMPGGAPAAAHGERRPQGHGRQEPAVDAVDAGRGVVVGGAAHAAHGVGGAAVGGALRLAVRRERGGNGGW